MCDEYELFEFLEADNNQENREEKERRRLTRELNDPFNYRESAFIKKYRLSKDLALALCDELRPMLSQPKKSTDISVETRVLAALAVYAHGTYQTPAGERRGNAIAQQIVSSALAQITTCLNSAYFRNKYIKFPQNFEERNLERHKFYNTFRMPGTIGCIDGTHVAIIRPVEHEERYFCRKHYHSLNVQLICNADMQITSVDASYGGATHDSFIWGNHPLKPFMENLRNETTWLLGDSGYPQRATMMTPIANAAPGTPEAHYTDMHVRTRNVVERTIGLLKARFRCLLVHNVLNYTPQMAGSIVNACVILHNICNRANIPVEPLSDAEARYESSMQPPPTVPQEHSNRELHVGIVARQHLVDRLWAIR